ncbi:MAG: hypothetical protein PHF19_05855 [Synergistales bacterium]|nr:hypothetical protein [Synergistales bacterium]
MRLVRTRRGRSRWKVSRSTAMGRRSADRPRMRPRLATLDPRTLPMTSSAEFLRVAETAAASSGAEVPKATMVRPTTRGERPSRRAREELPLTSSSPPP